VPDAYGVYKFLVDYHRIGYTHLYDVQQVNRDVMGCMLTYKLIKKIRSRSDLSRILSMNGSVDVLIPIIFQPSQ
jgi:hypothetical protein